MDERTVARFLSKVNKNGPIPEKRPDLGPCWVWRPLGGANGYPYFTANGKVRGAHRAAYEHYVDKIPDGYDVDHLCENRACVNAPGGHLKAATKADNRRRARTWEGGAAFQRDKTHCPYGHPYSGDNLRIAKNGRRCCRECERRYSREHEARKRAANPPQLRVPAEFCKRGHSLAEFGVMRGGKRRCGECDRDRTRQYRARRRAEQEPAVKMTCKHGHPWVEDNIYVDPRGHKHCKTCHNERSLARYYAAKAQRPDKPSRETCANGHPWVEGNIYVTPKGEMKCRECARERQRRYEAKLRAGSAR